MENTYKGYVVFLKINEGSKDARFVPTLVRSGEKPLELFMTNDNPFENNLLKEYHLKYCKVVGEFDENKNFFEINYIVVLADPATDIVSEIKSAENNTVNSINNE